MSTQTDRHTYIQLGRQIQRGKHTNRQTDTHTERQVDTQTDTQIDKDANAHIATKKNLRKLTISNN